MSKSKGSGVGSKKAKSDRSWSQEKDAEKSSTGEESEKKKKKKEKKSHLFFTYMSKKSDPTTLIPTSRPTKSTELPAAVASLLPTNPPTLEGCDPSCPCCDPQFDESAQFAGAIESYSENVVCYTRVDGLSDIIALAVCDTGQGDEKRDIAYFSYDYAYYGGTENEPVKYCGSGGYGDPDRLLLNEDEAISCEELVRTSREEQRVECGDQFC